MLQGNHLSHLNTRHNTALHAVCQMLCALGPQGWCGDCESCLNCELYQVPACVGADPRHTYSCNLGGLPDLDTSNAYVQDSIASYLNKLVDLGVVGIRIDAAKHIDPAELDAVLSRVKAPGLHVNQEVMLTGDCQCVHRQDYYR